MKTNQETNYYSYYCRSERARREIERVGCEVTIINLLTVVDAVKIARAHPELIASNPALLGRARQLV